MTAESVIDRILVAEGSAYTNDPRDSGGPTKYGITQAALAAWRGRPVGADEVERLGELEARKIYRDRYIGRPGYMPILQISPAIGAELVDTGVNLGPARATMFLQRALNALNNSGAIYPDARVDGEAGPATVSALQAYLRRRGSEGERVMLAALNALQGEFYIDLAERRPKDEAYAYGWLLNRVLNGAA